MKKMNKITIALTVVIIALLLVTLKLYSDNQKLRTTNTNLTQALELSNKLIKNTSAAYTEFGSCATNSSGCDYELSKTKLNALNQEKISIQEQLDTLIRKINIDSQ